MWVAVAAVVGAAGAAYASNQASQGAQGAANTQAAASRQAQATQQGQWEQTQRNMAPYLRQGVAAQNQLASRLPSLTSNYSLQSYLNSPEYAAQMAATQRQSNQLMASANASGMYGSGNMASALTSNAQNQAMQGYGQGLQDYLAQNQSAYNMLANQASAGQNAAAGLGSMGSNVANNISGLQVGAGNSLAQGQAGVADVNSALASDLSRRASEGLTTFGQSNAWNNYWNNRPGQTGSFGANNQGFGW